jgi:hypothetical protein
MKKNYANSGVDGSGGYEFQKHCALYIFLEKYQDIKDSKYFICLEHHEDFLFCYLDKNELIDYIETYQAKKSSKKWTLTKEFNEIIKKILEVGIDLSNDNSKKTKTYFHNLHFLSNHEINLSKSIKRKIYKNTVNERSSKIKFDELCKEIKDEILSLTDTSTKHEINNLIFSYIDFAKTFTSQKHNLVGMFCDVFEDKVLDPKASVMTLLSLFRAAENTLNQNNIVSLMDKSKRVESEDINKTLKIITSKQKTFDAWRRQKNKYSSILKIPIKDRSHFELEFENAFDYIKDLNQVEHQKINNFVNGIDLSDCYTSEEGLEKIIIKFNDEYNTQFDSITIKASILSSYIQLTEGIK